MTTNTKQIQLKLQRALELNKKLKAQINNHSCVMTKGGGYAG